MKDTQKHKSKEEPEKPKKQASKIKETVEGEKTEPKGLRKRADKESATKSSSSEKSQKMQDGKKDTKKKGPVATAKPTAKPKKIVAVKANASPKLKVSEKKATKPKTTKKKTAEKAHGKPKIGQMIDEAIHELGERKGSSMHAIKKYIRANLDADIDKKSAYMKKYLKHSIENGVILQKKAGNFNFGSSFRMAPKGHKRAAVNHENNVESE